MKKLFPPIAVILLGFALLTVGNADRLGISLPWPIPVVLPQPVTAAIIIEETVDRPKLSKEILAVLAVAPKHGVKVLDQNQKDKAGNCPPKGLEGYWTARGDKPLPQLVTRRGQPPNAIYESRPCPDNEAKLKELIK